MSKRVSGGVLVARLFFATLLGAAVGWPLLVGFAFASMTGVTPSGSPEWWAAALDGLFVSSSDSWVAWLLAAVVLACAGTGARDLVVLLYRVGGGVVAAFARSPRAPGRDPRSDGAVG